MKWIFTKTDIFVVNMEVPFFFLRHECKYPPKFEQQKSPL